MGHVHKKNSAIHNKMSYNLFKVHVGGRSSMAKEIEDKKDYRNRKKRYKRRRNFIIFTLLVIIASIGAVYIYRLKNKSYQSCKVMNTYTVKGNQTSGYLKFGSNIVRYNKDGAEAVDKSGKVLWNGSYNMSDPIADTCGNYVMIADRGGKLIHIYDEKGKDKSITTIYNILKAKVASQGVVAALMEENDKNYIKLYYSDDSAASEDNKDNVLVDSMSHVDTEGYPLDIALSEDGRKLVVVYMTMNTGKMICNIGFYNFGGVGQNQIDNWVGGYKTKSSIIVPEVTFLNNNTVCAYKDDGFALYSMAEKPKRIKEVTLKRKIESVLHNESYTGLVLEKTENEPRKLLIYNLSGSKVLDKNLDFDYNSIKLFGDEIVMHNDTSSLILKINGKVKFHHTFDENIVDLYPINNLDRYFLANDKKISEVLLTE